MGTAKTLYHGVGTTIFVSMALGAVYLGVFRAATRGLSNFEALQSPRLPIAAASTDFTKETQAGKESAVGSTNRSGQGCSDSSRYGQAAVLSALLTSVVMALLTGPLEMAKNRVQAGLVAEPLLQYTVSGRGFRDTLPFMGPFMLASVPQDFAELTLYYQGHKILEKLPEDSWPRCLIREHVFVVDAALGACAGICAVMLSMPADCIKTKLLTNYGAGGACGPCSSVSFSRALPGARTAWMGAARRTAAEQGPRGFFVGMVPRAVDEVPGSILHWTFAEGCTRWLEKF